MDIRRIQETSRLQTPKTGPRDVEASTTFSALIQDKREHKGYERLQQKLMLVEEHGQLLAESQTIEHLEAYKEKIKDFLKDALDQSQQLEEKRGFNRRGRTKIYKVVEQVDAKLLQLTDNVISGESRRFEILDQIGEIKGMLVNVFV
ncbi:MULTISPECIES: YaaR family protein [Exiguobacterium]|uniref:YaaR family protein n=1 Tax=Exiguobacterium TaxID=33986 RepID=UPI001AE69601|nr:MULTISPECIES: YaaR family protein [Exiguobacterium]MCT4781255.1 YaaR family protein [Exiguobacterium soli]